MQRRIIKVITADVPLGGIENPIPTIFEHYRRLDYDMIFFPCTTERQYMEFVVFDYEFLMRLGDLFDFRSTQDEENLYFEFHIDHMDEKTFFGILEEAHCQIKRSTLSLLQKVPETKF